MCHFSAVTLSPFMDIRHTLSKEKLCSYWIIYIYNSASSPVAKISIDSLVSGIHDPCEQHFLVRIFFTRVAYGQASYIFHKIIIPTNIF